MLISSAISNLSNKRYSDMFYAAYGRDETKLKKQADRYCGLIKEFSSLFGENREISLFSSPGRTEIGGNHTDHQNGRAFAGSVNIDIIGVASKNSENIIRVKSKGFEMDTVELENLAASEKEKESSAALIRGIADWFVKNGYKIGGFDMNTVSDVLKGSGLSSSAAFETLIGEVLNEFYNGGKVSPVEIARAGQYAENVFFGKPCGLLDQTACAVGGFVLLDFKESSFPEIKSIDFDFSAAGHSLCIVNTGGSHSNLTSEYASIPAEMKNVASFFGKSVLREVDEDEFFENIPQIRELFGDRAVLRAIHFFYDNDTPLFEASALIDNDFDAFLGFVNESGKSSFQRLQNIYTSAAPQSQNLSLALAVSEKVLAGRGAVRVHGGGFAGTIQAYVPFELLDEYRLTIENIFGKGSCMELSVRPVGSVKIM